MNNCPKHGFNRIAYDPSIGRYCAGCANERPSLHDPMPDYAECSACGTVYDRTDHWYGGSGYCPSCGVN